MTWLHKFFGLFFIPADGRAKSAQLLILTVCHSTPYFLHDTEQKCPKSYIVHWKQPQQLKMYVQISIRSSKLRTRRCCRIASGAIYYLCVLRSSHRAPASLLAAQRAVARPVFEKIIQEIIYLLIQTPMASNMLFGMTMRVAIITLSASKPPGGPESSGVELTKTVSEKYRPDINYLVV